MSACTCNQAPEDQRATHAGHRPADPKTQVESLLAAAAEPLDEGAWLDAYEFTFTPTGAGPVDQVLSAVVLAADTAPVDQWQSKDTPVYCLDYGWVPRADTAEQLIQRTADQAAAQYHRLLAALNDVSAMDHLDADLTHADENFIHGWDAAIDEIRARIEHALTAPTETKEADHV